jgi:cytidyltransferase-like protein
MKLRTVLVFGTFDILHPGHLAFLKEARRKGDYLIVVVTRDERVLAQKGRKPYFKEKERLAMVKEIKGVNAAMLGDSGKKWGVVRKLKPAVICVGYDRCGRPIYRTVLVRPGCFDTVVVGYRCRSCRESC